MTRSFHLLLAATTAIAAVACSKDDTAIKTTSNGETNTSPPADSAEARGHSLVRVVNAVNGGKDVEVKLDSTPIFEGVKPASVTDYREVSNNLAKFTVVTPGAGDAMVAQNDQILMDGNRYTVFLVAEDVSKNTLRIVKDEVIPDSGKARIRVVHAAPGGPELDIKVAGAKENLWSGVNFKSEAGYKDVDPETVTIEIRAENKPKVLLRIPKVELKRSTATTIVITGAEKLNFFKFTDAMMPPAPK